MANASTNIDLVVDSQSRKEESVNAMFDAMSPATAFALHKSATSGLTWAYYGGVIVDGDGAHVDVANGTVVLSASTTNYIESDIDGVVSKNTTGWTSGNYPLYKVSTGASTINTWEDFRTAKVAGVTSSISADQIDESALIPSVAGGLLWRGAGHSFGRRRIWYCQSDTNNAGFGINTQQNIYFNGGAATNPGISSHTNKYTATARTRYTTASSINARNGGACQNNDFVRGAYASCGGFIYEGILGFHSLNADSVFAFGLNGASCVSDPSTQTSCAFFGIDNGDSQIQFMHNDSSGTCTKVALGSDFPRPTVDVDLYFWRIYAEPNASSISYYLQKLNDNGKVATGSVSSNLPSNALAHSVNIYVGTGPTTATACAIDIATIYGETR